MIKMHRILAFFTAIYFIAGGAAIAQEETRKLQVIASIKPIHSLAAALMEDVAEPVLLIPGVASPHDYQLRPSEAASLQNADILFWIGAGLEGNGIASLAKNARIVTLSEQRQYEHKTEHRRENEHEHEGRHDHESEHEREGRHDHEHEEGEHLEFGTDLHIWLDPLQASEIVMVMAETLAEIDSKNANVYRANGQALLARLQGLDSNLGTRIAELHRHRSYIVFHNAYRHFETRYGLHSAGALLNSSAHGHEHGPSAYRLAELREQIHNKEENVACVFVEPAFSPSSAEALVEGTDVNIIVLDPLGADIPTGKDAYFLLMENLASSFEECLGAP